MVQVDLKCDLRSHYLIMILLIVAFTCSQLYSFMNETQQHSLALEQHVKQLASNLNQNANPSDLRLAEANGNRSPKQLALEKVAKRMDRYTLATTGKPDHITHKDCEEYAIDIGASFGQNLYNPGPGCVVTADFANVRYNPGECQHEHAAACDCSPNNQCINNPKTSNNFKSPTVKKMAVPESLPVENSKQDQKERPTAPKDVSSKVLLDFNGSPVDFLIAIKYVYWATLLMVRTINKVHRPRFIWFIATDAKSCNMVEKFSTNVRCVVETKVFNGKWSVPQLASKISTKKRAGWFFLQQLNFQAALSLEELSEHYIVWDADTIPTSKQLVFFNYETRQTIYYMNDENNEVPAAVAYHNSYELLTGLRIEHPRSRNYVSHFMCFSKTYAKAIVRHIATWRGVPLNEWMISVTESIDDPYLGSAGGGNGFADYDLYGSWVATFHKNRIILKNDWWKTRHIRIRKTPGSVEVHVHLRKTYIDHGLTNTIPLLWSFIKVMNAVQRCHTKSH